MGDDLDSFIRFMSYRKSATTSTMRTYKSNLTEFFKFLNNRKITLELINVYADRLALQNLAPRTYRNKLVIVRSYVSYLYVHGLTEIRPQQIMLPKLVETEASYLTADELTKLIKQSKKLRDKAMLLVLATSGLRVSEFINLRYEDYLENSLIVRNGKGGKPRLVFISEQAKRYLNKYIEKERGKEPGYLFQNYLGTCLSRQIVHRKVVEYARMAEIKKDVSVHTLRHTMATQMLINGARLEEVQQILGHTNIRTTMVYLHFSNNFLKQSYTNSLSDKIY